MAQNEKQAKSIRDLIADQNKILQENLRIQSKQAGIDSDILSDQQDIANVLKDQIKSLKFQVSEKSLIRKITSDINKISEKGYSLGQEELGTAKGIEKLQKGEIKLNDKIISSSNTHLSPDKRKVGYVFQDCALFPHLTILQNIFLE